MYDKGQGVVQNYAEALRWYRLAADQGQASAQANLGVMYGYGQGVVQNYAEALRWFSLAADQGHAIAQADLGVMYAKGQGVAWDLISAHMWLNIAAASGNKTAERFRDIVAKGMTPTDISKAQKLAREWMEKHQAQ